MVPGSALPAWRGVGVGKVPWLALGVGTVEEHRWCKDMPWVPILQKCPGKVKIPGASAVQCAHRHFPALEVMAQC